MLKIKSGPLLSIKIERVVLFDAAPYFFFFAGDIFFGETGGKFLLETKICRKRSCLSTTFNIKIGPNLFIQKQHIGQYFDTLEQNFTPVQRTLNRTLNSEDQTHITSPLPLITP